MFHVRLPLQMAVPGAVRSVRARYAGAMTTPAQASGWWLHDTRFKQRVGETDLRTFMQVCPERVHPRGSTLFRAGDPATHLHVVASGQVKLVVPTAEGRERILAVVGPDDIFGEAFVGAPGDAYRLDAVALTDVITCPMDQEQYRRLALHAPGFVVAFTRILADKVFACRDQLARVEAPIRARVAAELLAQGSRYGSEVGAGWVELVTELRHEDLAAMVSATRVSVTSAFASLRQAGVLEGTRGRYRLHLDGLADAAEDPTP
jgi:CRP/FNR family transcriptional regulator, cyclic AMP receptor protein